MDAPTFSWSLLLKTYVSIGLFFGVFFFFLFLEYLVSTPWFRNLYIKSKTRRAPYVSIISNPFGTLSFDMVSVEPLVDVEFSKSVSDKLVSIDLVAVKITGKRKERKRLVIELDGQAQGELIIKQYGK